MNAINVIAPYKYLEMRVLDDARVGLFQEPFVGGADSIIDRAVDDIPNAGAGFLLLFSATPFPGQPRNGPRLGNGPGRIRTYDQGIH